MIRTKSYFIANRPTALTVTYPVISNNVITIDASLSNYFAYSANGNNTTPKTIEIVGSSTKGTGAVATTESLSLHANTKPGDLVVVWVYSSATGSIIDVTSSIESNAVMIGNYNYGWMSAGIGSTSTGGMSAYAFNKVIRDKDPLSILYGSTAGATVAASLTLRNVITTESASLLLGGGNGDNYGGDGALVMTGTSGLGTVPNPPSVTTYFANSLIVCSVAIDGNNIASTLGRPAGYTAITSANASITGVTIGLSYKQQTTAGAEDPGAIGSTTYSWNSGTFGFAPINPSTYLNIINVPSKEYRMKHRINIPTEKRLEQLISMQSSNFVISQRVREWDFSLLDPSSEWYLDFSTDDWGNTWVIERSWEAY